MITAQFIYSRMRFPFNVKLRDQFLMIEDILNTKRVRGVHFSSVFSTSYRRYYYTLHASSYSSAMPVVTFSRPAQIPLSRSSLPCHRSLAETCSILCSSAVAFVATPASVVNYYIEHTLSPLNTDTCTCSWYEDQRKIV